MPKMLLLAKPERMASIRHQLGTGLPRAKTRTRTGTNARAGVEILAIELTIAAIEEQLLPSSRCYSRSLSRTSGILLLPRFSGPPLGSLSRTSRTLLLPRFSGPSRGSRTIQYVVPKPQAIGFFPFPRVSHGCGIPPIGHTCHGR